MAREADDAIRLGQQTGAIGRCEPVAEMMAARLCHDLAGLAGTVSGMLELATNEPTGSGDALLLAREAATQTVRRLRVLRAAWGGIADWPGDLLALVACVATDRLRVTLDPVALDRAGDAATGRLLLNVVLLGDEVLRGRGAIQVGGNPAGLSAALVASPVPDWPDDWPDLAGQTADPRLFQHAWTAYVAASCGAGLQSSGPLLRMSLAT